jgi:hypothetical protein
MYASTHYYMMELPTGPLISLRRAWIQRELYQLLLTGIYSSLPIKEIVLIRISYK